jgi:ParB/RepB/Spo0J family partition protein
VAQKGDRFVLVAGGRRLAAVTQLGWPTIPAIVKTLDHAAQAEIRFVENAERLQISPVEEAGQLSDYLDSHDIPLADVARKINRSLEWVKLRLSILQWPPDLVQHVHHARISLAAARSLAQIPDETTRQTAIDMAARNGITAAVAREWLRDSQAYPPSQNEPSQIAGCEPQNSIATTTTIECFACRERARLETTLSVRMCSNCMKAIAGVANDPRAIQTSEEAKLSTMLGPE